MPFQITPSTDLPVLPEVTELYPGDMLQLTVTHEIVVGGEKSWVKYGVSTTVQPGETAERARQRASRNVNKGVMDEIKTTVETVRLGAGL